MKGFTSVLSKGAKFVKEHKEDISSAVEKGTELAEKGSEFAEEHKDAISGLTDMAQTHLSDNKTPTSPGLSISNTSMQGLPAGLPAGLPKLPGGLDPEKALGSLKSAAESAKQMFSPQSNNNVDTMAASIASGEKLVDLLKKDLDNTNLGIKPNRYGGPAGPKFYDIIGDDLKKLLMENEQKNFKEMF